MGRHKATKAKNIQPYRITVKRNDMKICEVELNTHDLADENYSAKNGIRYMFATRELAADFVFNNAAKAQHFLAGSDIAVTRQMLLDNINDSSYYSIRENIKAESNEPGDFFDLCGIEPKDETQYCHVIEREVFEVLPCWCK